MAEATTRLGRYELGRRLSLTLRPREIVILRIYQGTVDVASIRIWLRDPIT